MQYAENFIPPSDPSHLWFTWNWLLHFSPSPSFQWLWIPVTAFQPEPVFPLLLRTEGYSWPQNCTCCVLQAAEQNPCQLEVSSWVREHTYESLPGVCLFPCTKSTLALLCFSVASFMSCQLQSTVIIEDERYDKSAIITVSVMLIVCVMVSRTFWYCISEITLPLPIHKGE